MIDKEVVSLLTRLIDHVESGVILSAIHPIIIDARELLKKIEVINCNDCDKFDVKNKRYTIDCFSCKRYWSDAFALREKGI